MYQPIRIAGSCLAFFVALNGFLGFGWKDVVETKVDRYWFDWLLWVSPGAR
jgi:hypothetical protein